MIWGEVMQDGNFKPSKKNVIQLSMMRHKKYRYVETECTNEQRCQRPREVNCLPGLIERRNSQDATKRLLATWLWFLHTISKLLFTCKIRMVI